MQNTAVEKAKHNFTLRSREEVGEEGESWFRQPRLNIWW